MFIKNGTLKLDKTNIDNRQNNIAKVKFPLLLQQLAVDRRLGMQVQGKLEREREREKQLNQHCWGDQNVLNRRQAMLHFSPSVCFCSVFNKLAAGDKDEVGHQRHMTYKRRH